MDNIRNPDDHVVTWDGDVVYLGRFHSHPADSRNRLSIDPRHPGSNPSLDVERRSGKAMAPLNGGAIAVCLNVLVSVLS